VIIAIFGHFGHFSFARFITTERHFCPDGWMDGWMGKKKINSSARGAGRVNDRPGADGKTRGKFSKQSRRKSKINRTTLKKISCFVFKKPELPENKREKALEGEVSRRRDEVGYC
jgi:hypothetical protein